MFGVVIYTNNKNLISTYETILKILRHYGFIVCITFHHLDSDWKQFAINNKVEPLPFGNELKDIIHFITTNGFDTILTVDNKNPLELPLINHVNVDIDLKSVKTFLGKPKERRFDISNKLESWENFILHLIQEGSLHSITHFEGQNYLFCGNGDLAQIPMRETKPGRGYMSKIKVKPLWNFSQSKDLIEKWNRFFVGSNVELVDTEPDFFLVINAAFEPHDPKRTIYFMMEPYGENLFSQYISKVKNDLLFYGSHQYHLNNCEWHCKWTLEEAKNLNLSEIRNKKVKGLSIIISDKNQDPGQRYRIQVAKHLDDLASKNQLPFILEIWGRCKSLGFSSYKGEVADYSKNEVLERFQYHFNVENNSIENYITEKLWDPILCGCFTFYLGPKDIQSFIGPTKNVVQLSGSVETDVNTIIETINSDAYFKHINTFQSTKDNMVKFFNIPSRLISIFNISNCLTVLLKSKKYDSTLPSKLKSMSLNKIIVVDLNPTDIRWFMALENLSTNYGAEPLLIIFDETVPDILYKELSAIVIEHDDNLDVYHLNFSGQNDFGFTGVWWIPRKGIERIVECMKIYGLSEQLLKNIKIITRNISCSKN